MKKLLIILTAIFMFMAMVGSVQATPFYVVDTSPDTTSCIIVFDNSDEVEVPVPLLYDLEGNYPPFTHCCCCFCLLAATKWARFY